MRGDHGSQFHRTIIALAKIFLESHGFIIHDPKLFPDYRCLNLPFIPDIIAVEATRDKAHRKKMILEVETNPDIHKVRSKYYQYEKAVKSQGWSIHVLDLKELLNAGTKHHFSFTDLEIGEVNAFLYWKLSGRF